MFNIKKTLLLAFAGLVIFQSGLAFGFSRVDRFSFVDTEGDSVAAIACHSLKYNDDVALRKMTIDNRGEEIIVDSILIKSKTMVLNFKGVEASKSVESITLDLEKNRCDLNKEY
jgi:hypothetical protein